MHTAKGNGFAATKKKQKPPYGDLITSSIKEKGWGRLRATPIEISDSSGAGTRGYHSCHCDNAPRPGWAEGALDRIGTDGSAPTMNETK